MTTFTAAGVEDGSCFWDGLPGFRAAPGKQIKKRPRRRGQRPRRGGRAAEMRSPPQANAGKQSQKVLGMTGWTLIPDVTKPCALTITGAGSGTLTVAGDATGLAAAGGVFRIVPPAGVSVSSGALATAQSAGLNTFDDPGCMWLWSGYRYIPPQVGHDIGGTTYGAQPGGNKLGQYYCHHRVYDILTSRWTSPDPAASPWTNLQDYCGNNPVQGRDPSGLAAVVIAAGVALTAAEVVAIIGAAAFAICMLEGTCVKLIEEAWRQIRPSSGGGCSTGGTAASGGGAGPAIPIGHVIAMAMAAGAAAAVDHVARIGYEAAKRPCEEL